MSLLKKTVSELGAFKILGFQIRRSTWTCATCGHAQTLRISVVFLARSRDCGADDAARWWAERRPVLFLLPSCW